MPPLLKLAYYQTQRAKKHIEPVNGEMATVKANELPVNFEADSELSDTEGDQAKAFWDRLADNLI